MIEILLICACIGSFSVGVLVGLWKPWVSDEPLGNQTEVMYMGRFEAESRPVFFDWGRIDDEYQWVAIDRDGSVCAYAERPELNEKEWSNVGLTYFTFMHYVVPPLDFTKCIWQRPTGA